MTKMLPNKFGLLYGNFREVLPKIEKLWSLKLQKILFVKKGTFSTEA